MNAGFSDKVTANKVSKCQVTCQAFAGIESEELAAVVGLCYKDDHSETGKAVYGQVCQYCPRAGSFWPEDGYRPVAYNAKTGLSGVNIDGNIIRKGSIDAVHNYFLALGHAFPDVCILAEKNASTCKHKTEVICKNGEVIGMVTLVLEQSVVFRDNKSNGLLTA